MSVRKQHVARPFVHFLRPADILVGSYFHDPIQNGSATGHVSIPGVYGGMADKFPIGALMEKGLFIASGQTHVQKYTEPLLKLMAGLSLAPEGDGIDALCGELGGHLRALLRDVLCGHLDSDLREVADHLLRSSEEVRVHRDEPVDVVDVPLEQGHEHWF